MTRLSPRNWIGLVVVAASLFGASPTAHAESDQQLVSRFDQAEAAGRYDDALQAALAIVKRHPDATFWAFNAGRMHARLGQGDEAIAMLRVSADGGFTGIASLEDHTDLDSVRKRPEFAAILAKVRANAQKRFDEFKAEALKHKHPEYVPRSLPKDRKPGAIIALHGSGGTGAQMVNACKRTCNELGLICIAPDAVRPQGNGYSWTYRDESAWLVEQMVKKAIEDHGADPERIYLVGFSQGANIALVMTRTHAKDFAGVVPVCGHYESGNATASARATPPAATYLVTGARDAWNETYAIAQKEFEADGGKAEVRIVPGMGHAMVNTAELTRAIEWCAKQPGT